MKVKDIKKLIEQFNDDDNILLECCIDETAKKGTYKNEIINNEPFEIELYYFDSDYNSLMFNVKEYK